MSPSKVGDLGFRFLPTPARDVRISNVVIASLPVAWRYGVSARTGWLDVSVF